MATSSGISRSLTLLGLLLVASAAPLRAQDWVGYEGGGGHHNASAAPVDGAGLLWLRTFPAFEHPDIAKREGSGYASRNLVTRDGHIAVVGCAEPIDPKLRDRFAQLTILDRLTGKTEAVFATRQRTGINSVHRGQLPTGYYGNAVDVPGGFQVLQWDRQTGRLFLCAGGDSPAMSGLDVLPHLDEWKPGTVLPVPGAFGGAAAQAKGADGKTRAETKAPMNLTLEDDWLAHYGSNRAAFFSMDDTSPLIVLPGAFGHTQGSDWKALSKHSGLQINEKWNIGPTVFHFRDTIMAVDGCIYGIGPAQDCDGSGDLGNMIGLSTTRPDHGHDGRYVFARNDPGGPDQGLKVWCKRARFVDKQNDGTDEHPAFLDTVELADVFLYDLPSAHIPRRGPHDAYSYLETDGFQRDKSMIVEDGRLWVAWKPSLDGPVVLVHADADGVGEIPLGVGRGMRGQDIWPRMGMTEVGGRKRIVYCLANAYDRDYLDQDYPWSARDNAWSAERKPPRGPSALAVVDPEQGRLLWTANLTERHPDLPVNDFWLHADRVQMVLAGEQAWIGWVGLTDEKAVLKLARYDLSADAPQHEEFSIPLPFASADAQKSYCTDLIAVDGTLYALVTETATMWPGASAREHYNYTAQHVLAIGRPAR